MKRLIILTTAMALIMTSCYTDPVADFIFSPSDPLVGEDVYFENLSYDADAFQWEFDDGSGSPAFNPVHAFMTPGTYNVTLKAFGDKSGFDVAYASVTVTAVDPYADFYLTTDIPGEDGNVALETDVVFVGEQITFNNLSDDAASVLWEFGDDVTSNIISPSYSYDTPGTYTVSLHAYGLGDAVDSYSKTIEVYEGRNSTVRITVLEYFDEYPVEGASVLLFPSVIDWEEATNSSYEVFTSELGKCVFEDMAEQMYYVDVWEADHDNYELAAESVDWIETQYLENDYIHDFIAYVDYYEPGKKAVLTRLGKKKLAMEKVSDKKSSEYRIEKDNKFSKKK
jgi:PKD repeat protein